jgi:hypothetical protein
MKLLCRLGIHHWEYVQTTIRMPGGLFRICLRCTRPEYHEGTTL